MDTLPMQLSLLNNESNSEINIPVFFQVLNKGRLITELTGIRKIFMTGINYRNHFPRNGKNIFLTRCAY